MTNGTRTGIGSAGRGGLAAIAAAVFVALMLLWMAGESHYRSCIAKVNAQYPAVPVSAFVGRQTGPLKVSFVKERTRAANDCSRFF